MTAVDPDSGIITSAQLRTFGDVSKGYTLFRDGDVIFARITPCMQNGKSAVARDLENGVGVGSTEFHVLRPTREINAEYLHVIVRLKSFRADAASHFTGTAGQQRVPRSFFDGKIIQVPPLPEQKRIVEYLDGLQAKLDEVKRLQTETAAELDALLPSVLHQAFNGGL
jgi:type I restriction enzyme S subunit